MCKIIDEQKTLLLPKYADDLHSRDRTIADDDHIQQNERLGYGLLVISAALFVVSDTLVRMATTWYFVPPDTVFYIRGLFNLPLGLIWAFWYGVRHSWTALFDRRDNLPFLLYGALTGLYQLTLLRALSYISVGECTTFFYTNPVFTLVLSALILRTRVNWKSTLSCALVVAGVALVSLRHDPALQSSTPMLSSTSTTNTHAFQGITDRHTLGVFYSIATALLMALSFIVLAFTNPGAPTVKAFVPTTVWMMIFSVMVDRESITTFDSLYSNYGREAFACVLLSSFLWFFLFSLKTMAFQLCKPANAAIVNTIGVPFAYVASLCLLAEHPTVWTTAGSIMIVLGSLFVTLNSV